MTQRELGLSAWVLILLSIVLFGLPDRLVAALLSRSPMQYLQLLFSTLVLGLHLLTYLAIKR